jgi:hypothetical protein
MRPICSTALRQLPAFDLFTECMSIWKTDRLSQWRNGDFLISGSKSHLYTLFIGFGANIWCSEGNVQQKRTVATRRVRLRYLESPISQQIMKLAKQIEMENGWFGKDGLKRVECTFHTQGPNILIINCCSQKLDLGLGRMLANWFSAHVLSCSHSIS